MDCNNSTGGSGRLVVFGGSRPPHRQDNNGAFRIDGTFATFCFTGPLLFSFPTKKIIGFSQVFPNALEVQVPFQCHTLFQCKSFLPTPQLATCKGVRHVLVTGNQKEFLVAVVEPSFKLAGRRNKVRSALLSDIRC